MTAVVTDIALRGSFDLFDLAIVNDDLELEDGLRTAVLLSIFTDARADEDELPDTEPERRGWWADVLADDDTQKTGSKLWLLAREKDTPDLLPRLEECFRAALQWLLDDNIVSRITVTVESKGQGFIGIRVALSRETGGKAVAFNFDYAWKAGEQR